MNIKDLTSLPITKNIFDTKNYKFNYLPKDENGREINIYKLNNAQCVGESLLYPNILLLSYNSLYELYLPTKEKTMSLNSKTIYEENGMTFKFDKKETNNEVD